MERVTTGAREPVQLMATLVGATFLLIGIVGFIPGLPSNLYGGLDFAGHNSQAEIFHLFQTSWLHNIVHLALGIAGLALAHTSAGARSYLIVGGVIYLALWLYGLIVGPGSGANFVPLDTADDWLHFFLGLGMITLAFITTGSARRPDDRLSDGARAGASAPALRLRWRGGRRRVARVARGGRRRDGPAARTRAPVGP
jgi:hypothetical protein